MVHEREVFLAAIEIDDESERSAYLDRVCGGDARLRKRVEALLRFQQEEHSFLQQPHEPLDDTTFPGGIAERPGAVIDRFKLLELIGEGGFGVVYMADQLEPVQRRVALKIIKPGMDTKQVIGRFEAERQALAMMDHPNIARILDGGTTESGRPFFALELVKGVPITQFCDDNKLRTEERLRLFHEVCNAVQHAHQKGIIHRDLKPSNIMVTMHDDQPVPKIIDFGIAKATQQRLTEKTVFTRFQHFMGTPSYMSPEQASFTGLDMDTRSDIYSLGVLLYELLTGTTPFDQEKLRNVAYDEICRKIRDDVPPIPSQRISTLGEQLQPVSARRKTEAGQLGRTLRGELDWIVMKALEKDRTRRYDTASAFAQDISLYLTNQPVSAGRPSLSYRVHKFVQRNRSFVASACVVVLALLIGSVAATVGLLIAVDGKHQAELARQKEVKEKLRADKLRSLAETREQVARHWAYAADMNRGMNALRARDMRQVHDSVNNQRPKPGESDLRGWEWRYLWQYCQSDSIATHQEQEAIIRRVSFIGDGEKIALGTHDGSLLIWEPQSDRLARASSKDGLILHRILLSGGRTLGLKSLGTLAVSDTLSSLTMSDKGQRFAMDIGNGTIVLADTETGKEISRISTTERPVSALCFSQDAGMLAIGQWNGRTTIVDTTIVDTGTRELPILYEFYGAPLNTANTALAFSPDATRIVVASQAEVRLFDLRHVAIEQTRPVSEPGVQANSLAFLPGSARQLLISANSDTTVTIWDMNGLRQVGQLRGHLSEIVLIAVSSDGKRAVSVDTNSVVNVWDLEALLSDQPLAQMANYVFLPAGDPISRSSVEYRADRNRELCNTRYRMDTSSGTNALAILDTDGSVKLLDLKYPEPTRIEQLGMDNLGLLYLSNDLLAVTNATGQLKLSDRDSVMPAHTGPAVPIRYLNENGGLLFTCESFNAQRTNANMGIWHANTWEPSLIACGSDVLSMDVAPVGSAMATVHDDSTVRLWSSWKSEQPYELGRHAGALGVEFSPDGRLLATYGEDAKVRLWDTDMGKQIAVLSGHSAPVASVAFTPDGQRIASGGSGADAVKLWDVGAIQRTDSRSDARIEIATMQATGTFMCVKFSTDERFLIAYSVEGHLHIWHAPTMVEIKERSGDHADRLAVAGE